MLTNTTGMPLSLAVWLAQDDYDYSDDPNTISATTLLKPMKAIVLARQNKELEKNGDISTLLPSRMGTALHDSLEKAWINPDKVKETLSKLGHPDSIINKVLINPTKEELTNDCIPIYVEQRGVKQVGEYKVSGKFDFRCSGTLRGLQEHSSIFLHNAIQ